MWHNVSAKSKSPGRQTTLQELTSSSATYGLLQAGFAAPAAELEYKVSTASAGDESQTNLFF